MMLSSGSGKRQYQNAKECGMKIIRHEGYSALMNGSLTQITFILTANCIASLLLIGLNTAAAKNQ